MATLARTMIADTAISEWEITAHHEASHVLAYLTYGLRFRRVVIRVDADGEVDGAVTVNGAGNGDYSCIKRAVICLAGPVGEARYCNVNPRDVLASNFVKTDVAMAMDALQHPKAPPLDVALAAAQRLVEREWLRITRLAAELSRRGELDYDQCRIIIAARR